MATATKALEDLQDHYRQLQSELKRRQFNDDERVRMLENGLQRDLKVAEVCLREKKKKEEEEERGRGRGKKKRQGAGIEKMTQRLLGDH